MPRVMLVCNTFSALGESHFTSCRSGSFYARCESRPKAALFI